MNSDLMKLLDDTKVISIFKFKKEEGSSFFVPNKILEIENLIEINNLSNVIAVHDISPGSLRTTGEYFLEFELNDDRKVQVEYVTAGHIRSEKLWLDKGDAKLKDTIGFLKWLAKVGLEEPLKQEGENELRKSAERRKNILIASKIPKALLGANGRLNTSLLRKESNDLYENIKKENLDEYTLLSSLFELMVLRSDNWNEVSILEMLITKVLLGVSIDSINQFLVIELLSENQLEGAARFLTTSEFQTQRKQEISSLNSVGKDRLVYFLQNKGDARKLKKFEEKIMMI